jgi:hypothetical protein
MARLNAVIWLFFSPRRHPRISKTPACIYFSDTCTFERYRPLPDPSRGQEAASDGISAVKRVGRVGEDMARSGLKRTISYTPSKWEAIGRLWRLCAH